jgi:hypothetical protein
MICNLYSDDKAARVLDVVECLAREKADVIAPFTHRIAVFCGIHKKMPLAGKVGDLIG